MSAYDSLRKQFHLISSLQQARGFLEWDMQTVMPEGGAEARSEQLAALQAVCHERLTDPRMAEWLDAAADDVEDPWDVANLREMRRTWEHTAGVDPDLVEALARAGTRCTMLWRSARRDNDFAGWAPAQQEVVSLVRDLASQKGARLGLDPYDALLDQFEPGMTAVRIETVFAPLTAAIPSLIDEVLEAQAGEPQLVSLEGTYPIERQRQLALTFMNLLGYDDSRGRLDVSVHPFCGGGPDDVRITTRYREDEFLSSLMGVLHETGHALYELNLPRQWRSQPVGRARSMGVHESQSLSVEMQLSRSRHFIEFALPTWKEAFGGEGPAWEIGNIVRRVQRVERGLIRVDADEVTYPMHVVLRFELERALIAGSLDVADLPDAWREGMQAKLGIVPSDDRDGCMQDIHWTDGAFGYFPSYTLGAMTAAQLFEAMRDAHPDLDEKVRRGELAVVTDWLAANVHQHASRFGTEELVERATGRPLDPQTFLRHLRRRYVDARGEC